MKLTNEQLQAIQTLRKLAGDEFRAVWLTKHYVEIPKEWFMSTFSPSESVQELFSIENPDMDEMHVMHASWNGMTCQAVLYGRDHEKWVKEWEGQTNE